MTLKRSLSIAVLGSFTLFAFAACEEEAGVDGDPCADGSECESRLCFIAVSGEPGECRAVPSSCEENPSCTQSTCLEGIESECTGSGSSCLSVAGTVTIECSTPSNDGGGGA
ncbi:MAG: hypothetical protein HOW73_12095 [Polyangiaceae bacterium]|nr:hypothetical protein [Polyangiaceae bacterium]